MTRIIGIFLGLAFIWWAFGDSILEVIKQIGSAFHG